MTRLLTVPADIQRGDVVADNRHSMLYDALTDRNMICLCQISSDPHQQMCLSCPSFAKDQDALSVGTRLFRCRTGQVFQRSDNPQVSMLVVVLQVGNLIPRRVGTIKERRRSVLQDRT